MIDELKRNIETEINMLREITIYFDNLKKANPAEKKMIDESITSLKESIKLINNSIPKILSNISAAQKLPSLEKQSGLERINVKTGEITRVVTLDKKDKEKFLKEVSMSERLMKKLNRKEITEKEIFEEFKGARGYLKYANKFFLDKAQKLTKKGYFKPLAEEIKKANLEILFDTYIAMTFFTMAIAFIFSIVLIIFLTFFSLSFSFPIISIYEGNNIIRFLTLLWMPIVLPIATFAVLYYYPSTERKSITSRIDQELPFAVIYMSAISGAGIEPTEIFKIIGASKEYPFLRREVRKILNQINIYGYDLVTALNNVSKTTPSTKLAELLSGMATTTSSGGGLSEFFSKRAETLLLSYRLERENYTHLAETFMDIYISVVIATPMILMLLLVVLSVSAPDIGLSPIAITVIIVAAVSLINVFFLTFLHIKQPTY
ncbi:MAG: type II secretion system F family protein [archaeon]|nr:type II secretion system F family protein [archaeon]